jgi:Raf kinase inhibitor-like YbhB/YbcL family protein
MNRITLFSLFCSPRKEQDGTARPAPNETTFVSKSFTLSSDSFADNGPLPDRLALERGGSPQLAWSQTPKDAARLVIIMDDPDARRVVGHTFVHWVASLPADVMSLPEAASTGGWTGKPKTLTGASTSTAYAAPKPPAGTGVHRYFIKIYAMAASFRHPDFDDLARSERANDRRTYTRERFEAEFAAHVLASAEISGTYSVGAPRPH